MGKRKISFTVHSNSSIFQGVQNMIMKKSVGTILIFRWTANLGNRGPVEAWNNLCEQNVFVYGVL